MMRVLKFVSFATALFCATASSAADKKTNVVQREAIQRGKYLVERVGMCADCHSPRNEKGQFVSEQWLLGAPLGFAPTVPMPAWAPVAPPIAGLDSMTDAEAVGFFTSGARPDGSHARPPMPEYRFDQADAEALVAYLKSLAKN